MVWPSCLLGDGGSKARRLAYGRAARGVRQSNDMGGGGMCAGATVVVFETSTTRPRAACELAQLV